MGESLCLIDYGSQLGAAKVFTTAHAGTSQMSSAAVKGDQLRFSEQSSVPPMLTQGTDDLAQGGSCCLACLRKCNEYSN